jgi:hypothetical protein
MGFGKQTENSRVRAALNKNFCRSITRGVLFEKTTPLDPLQKLLIMYSKTFNEKFLRGAGAVFSKSTHRVTYCRTTPIF